MGGNTTFTVSSSNASQTIAGSIAESSSSSITKSGPGTLVLSAVNGYSGGTMITGGELSVATDGGLSASSGTLTLNGGLLQVTGTSYSSTARTIILGSAGGGFDIANAARTFTVSQIFTGNGALTKQGAGTLVLAGASSYTGGTNINSGLLIAAALRRAGPLAAWGQSQLTVAQPDNWAIRPAKTMSSVSGARIQRCTSAVAASSRP